MVAKHLICAIVTYWMIVAALRNKKYIKLKLISNLKNLINPRGAAGQKNDIFSEVLFNSTLYGFIVYSKETYEVTEINNVVYKLFELPDGKSLTGLYLQQVMMRYLSGESPNMEPLMNDLDKDWSGEALFISHKKNKFNAVVNTNIVNQDIDTEYRIMSILDISELKNSMKKVDVAHKKMESALKAKSRFLSSVSHELRTPLNGIIGASNLVLENRDLSKEVHENVSLIRYSSEHMLSIVNNILDFSKIEVNKASIHVKEFGLLQCLQNIVASFRLQFKEKDIELITEFPDDLDGSLKVLSDETKLNQVVKNLLSNALKFTLSGSVKFSLKIKELTKTKAGIYFEIQDTGIGIPEDKKEEIFMEFTQIYNDDLKRTYEGTGLGLTISSKLVELMGGKLEVESVFGKGSTFFFTLPFNMPEEKAPEPETSELLNGRAEKKDIRGVRALIVEDNEINARILRSFLTKWQMPVKEAITGVHALELVKFHKFDIILMDLEMPEMNGFTALEKIRKMNIDTPVIAFTATLLEDMNSLITESGFTDYISKPFKPADLRKKIEKYCERKVDYV